MFSRRTLKSKKENLSRIQDMEKVIPDPDLGGLKAPDLGSRIRILKTAL
jgi:hypothetical protein